MKTSFTKQQLLHMIQENLTNIFYPENYLIFLNQLSFFHEESIENIILIFTQCPTATVVLPYKAWQSYHRTVRRGYTAIALLRDSINNNQVRLVFDIEHTVGKEFISTHPAIHIKQMSRILSSMLSKIKIDSILQTVTDDTTLQIKHALQHYIYHLLHTSFPKYCTSEIEMKSILYCVYFHYGIDVSEYSFSSIALWAKQKTNHDLREALNVIRHITTFLIDTIDYMYVSHEYS